jgi:hypothetical protein
MSLVKFPSAIKPSRVTAQLIRSDELFSSPVTGIQQTASRGNAYWRHTIEYRDLSLSEREVVQAFLAKCKGSLNHFKLPDFGGYTIPGDISTTFADVFSNRGHEWTTAGSDGAQDINSYFGGAARAMYNLSDDNELMITWRLIVSTLVVRYDRDLLGNSQTDLLQANAAYVHRLKFWQPPNKIGASFSARVSTGGGQYVIQYGAVGPSRPSSDCVHTIPFYTGTDVSSTYADLVFFKTNEGTAGDTMRIADYYVSRCALVSNSENLFTRSNEFDHADWTFFRCSADSGYGETDPVSFVSSGAWKLKTGNYTNSSYYFQQSITKPTTEDMYTFSIYAKADELMDVRLLIGDNAGTVGYASAYFHLESGTVDGLATPNPNVYRPKCEIYPTNSGWNRCTITAIINSTNGVQGRVYISSKSDQTFDGDGSAGVLIYGAQMNRHPFAGNYVPITDTAVVGSGNWQTGSQLNVAGLDPHSILKAGTRFEIINQYHNDASNLYERSEFKRLTRETRTNYDGTATLEFDPPIRNAPVNDRSYATGAYNTETVHNAVIFSNPEIKSRLVGSTIQYIEKPLQLTDVVFDVIEDLSE